MLNHRNWFCGFDQMTSKNVDSQGFCFYILRFYISTDKQTHKCVIWSIAVRSFPYHAHTSIAIGSALRLHRTHYSPSTKNRYFGSEKHFDHKLSFRVRFLQLWRHSFVLFSYCGFNSTAILFASNFLMFNLLQNFCKPQYRLKVLCKVLGLNEFCLMKVIDNVLYIAPSMDIQIRWNSLTSSKFSKIYIVISERKIYVVFFKQRCILWKYYNFSIVNGKNLANFIDISMVISRPGNFFCR